jgi:DNA-binding transcriptional LysR family regulator
MDFNQLRAFEQIVLRGSFSKAARHLGISQPTISLRIQTLEHEIGGQLLTRGGHRTGLTEQGRNFLPYAQAALRAMTMGSDVVQQTKQGHRGKVTIATIPTLATGFVTKTLVRLHRQHPHLSLTVHSGHNQQVADMLYEGLAHIGFVTEPFFHPDMKPLLQVQEPLLLVTHPRLPLLHVSAVCIADIAERSHPFVCVDWSLESRQWQMHSIANNQPFLEAPPQMALDLLLQGVGVTLLTRSLASEYLQSGRVVEIGVRDMPPFRRECAVICSHRAEPLPKATSDFLHILHEEAYEFGMP